MIAYLQGRPLRFGTDHFILLVQGVGYEILCSTQTLTALEGRVPGLFLGRFAHDPEAVGAILDEALALTRSAGEARS